MTSSDMPLTRERDALGRILHRLMEEVTDLETLCKHAPRIVSVAINAARIQSALVTAGQPSELDALQAALRELATETNDEEEQQPW